MNARDSLTFALSLKRDIYPEKTGGYIRNKMLFQHWSLLCRLLSPLY